MTNNLSLSVIVPCYNESENIDSTVPKITKYCEKNKYQLIFVNDGSKDNTKDLLKQYSNPFLKVYHHKVNKGYGAAIKTGITNCKTDYLITIDSDGQHRLEDIDRLVKKLQDTDADMIVGSRSNQKSASIYRGFGKYIIRTIARFFIPHNIQDINSGMKLYKAELAKKYLKLCPDTMAYSDIILLMFISNRNLVLEENITINERTKGVSTISTKTAIGTVFEIINIIVLFNPMKLFLPSAAFFFIFGLIWGIRSFIYSHQLSTGSEFLVITSIILFFMGINTEQLSRIRRNL